MCLYDLDKFEDKFLPTNIVHLNMKAVMDFCGNFYICFYKNVTF